MNEVTTLLQATLRAHVAPDVRVSAVARRAAGAQGYSGATLRYYDVTYARADTTARTTLVTKEAALPERRTHTWLSDHRLPMPFGHTLDLTTDAAAPLCMQYLEGTPMEGERVGQAARVLAAIHHAALGRADALPWLPRATPALLADWVIDACWRRGWQSVLAGRGYINESGRHLGPPKPGADFAATFAPYTRPLEDAATRFVRAMGALWAADDALTLLHGDFHRAHVRTHAQRAAVLDWGQALYGPLYLDLPHYFSRAEAPRYRDALAALGHAIPPDEFLARYDAARAYVGFKYFGIGLWEWCYGDPPHRRDRVQRWIALALQTERDTPGKSLG